MPNLDRYMPLVVSIAKTHVRPGIDIQDLIQEGFIGLIEAEKRFNPDLGIKLSTYATWWIRKYVLLHIDQHIKSSICTQIYEEAVSDQRDVMPYLLKLNPVDLEIIVLRFGFGDHDSHTYQDLGDRFKKSREWARKKVKQILKLIREEIKDTEEIR